MLSSCLQPYKPSGFIIISLYRKLFCCLLQALSILFLEQFRHTNQLLLSFEVNIELSTLERMFPSAKTTNHRVDNFRHSHHKGNNCILVLYWQWNVNNVGLYIMCTINSNLSIKRGQGNFIPTGTFSYTYCKCVQSHTNFLKWSLSYCIEVNTHVSDDVMLSSCHKCKHFNKLIRELPTQYNTGCKI